MPRPRRLEPAGVALHVIQRGNNRAPCFFSDIDRLFYLKCLARFGERRGCAIHAYALMTNHVHLLVTPSTPGGVSRMLQDVGRQYVRTINNARSRTGTLWDGRFKSNLVDSETYLLTCHRYIELNPVRAGIVAAPAESSWTSHSYYAHGTPNKMIAEHPVYVGLAATPDERRRRFLSLFDSPIHPRDLTNLRTAVNKGWALGSDAFLDRMETTLGESVRPARRGRPRTEGKPSSRTQENSQKEMLL